MQNIEKCLPLLSVVDGLDIWLASLVMGHTSANKIIKYGIGGLVDTRVTRERKYTPSKSFILVCLTLWLISNSISQLINE